MQIEIIYAKWYTLFPYLAVENILKQSYYPLSLSIQHEVSLLNFWTYRKFKHRPNSGKRTNSERAGSWFWRFRFVTCRLSRICRYWADSYESVSRNCDFAKPSELQSRTSKILSKSWTLEKNTTEPSLLYGAKQNKQNLDKRVYWLSTTNLH